MYVDFDLIERPWTNVGLVAPEQTDRNASKDQIYTTT